MTFLERNSERITTIKPGTVWGIALTKQKFEELNRLFQEFSLKSIRLIVSACGTGYKFKDRTRQSN